MNVGNNFYDVVNIFGMICVLFIHCKTYRKSIVGVYLLQRVVKAFTERYSDSYGIEINLIFDKFILQSISINT